MPLPPYDPPGDPAAHRRLLDTLARHGLERLREDTVDAGSVVEVIERLEARIAEYEDACQSYRYDESVRAAGRRE